MQRGRVPWLAADRVLLESIAAADRAEAARIERRLRDFTLDFVLAGPERVAPTIEAGLEELLERGDADATFLATVTIPAATIPAATIPAATTPAVAMATVKRPTGSTPTTDSPTTGIPAAPRPAGATSATRLPEPAPLVACGNRALVARTLANPGLLAAAVDSLAVHGVLEHPSDGHRGLAPAAQDALGQSGLRSLRLSVRRMHRETAVVLGLLASREARYWSPSCRHLQDGLADVLVVVLGRLLAQDAATQD